MIEGRDLLIFTVYLIIVFYVFYQANLSLRSKVRIEPDFEDLKRQLDEQNLRDLIEVKFKFKDSYEFSDFTSLPISIKNISKKEETVRIDWDQSAIDDFDNDTVRVIRLTSGMTDIPQSQAVSIIVPNRMIDEQLSDDQNLKGPLFKIPKFRKAVEKSKPFYLRLFLMISDPENPPNKLMGYLGRTHFLRCRFIPKKLTWPRALTIAMKPK